MVTKIQRYSSERKSLIESGDAPEFLVGPGYQMLAEKYLQPEETPRDMYVRIARTSADVADSLYPGENWYDRFFDAMWKGWLSPSTPVLANLGTNNGLPVSCSGNYVNDSVLGFFKARLEVAVLSKQGFGTASYMGAVRHRGSSISVGGKASGVVPVIEGFRHDMSYVAQGMQRRGSWAGYLEIEHGDFDELSDLLMSDGDNLNVGWIMDDGFVEKLNHGNKEAVRRYQKIMKIRATLGKGYLMFRDKARGLAPKEVAETGLQIQASQLCSEIFLPSDENHTYSCVLSSINLAHYDDWKDTDLVQTATVFLDCIAEILVRKGSLIEGMENTVRFTEKARALGLGVLGWHSYLQKKMWAVDSLPAQYWNSLVFEEIQTKANEASVEMATLAGEPEWLKGSGRRNLTLMAIAPTMSTATICGGVSQGIEPLVANIYTQGSSAGDLNRVNPELLKMMKERKVYTKATAADITQNKGSVQHVDWLSDGEKKVFRTAFEIDQQVLVRLANQRSKFIDQGTSLNLFFAAKETPAYISRVHRQAIESSNIKSLYYMRSLPGVQPVSETDACSACEG